VQKISVLEYTRKNNDLESQTSRKILPYRALPFQSFVCLLRFVTVSVRFGEVREKGISLGVFAGSLLLRGKKGKSDLENVT